MASQRETTFLSYVRRLHLLIPKEISGDFGNKILNVCTRITLGPVPIKVAVPPIEEALLNMRQKIR